VDGGEASAFTPAGRNAQGIYALTVVRVLMYYWLSSTGAATRQVGPGGGGVRTTQRTRIVRAAAVAAMMSMGNTKFSGGYFRPKTAPMIAATTIAAPTIAPAPKM